MAAVQCTAVLRTYSRTQIKNQASIGTEYGVLQMRNVRCYGWALGDCALDSA